MDLGGVWGGFGEGFGRVLEGFWEGLGAFWALWGPPKAFLWLFWQISGLAGYFCNVFGQFLVVFNVCGYFGLLWDVFVECGLLGLVF